jgi:hypothetical protein
MGKLNLENYLTPTQLGEELGKLRGKALHKNTLLSWRRNGIGPPVTMIADAPYYYLPSVEKWIRDQEVAA